MDATAIRTGVRVVIERSDLDRLFDALRVRGYTVIAPRVRDGAIVLAEISAAADLPAGWTDEQEAGRYRLARSSDPRLFHYTVGPDAAKRLLHPPTTRLWRAQRTDRRIEFVEGAEPAPKLALIGLRACDLAAIAIQDRVFLEGPFADPIYAARRRQALLVAVQCERMGPTCFCDSMDSGPVVGSGCDLALTELLENAHHLFVAEAHTERGRELLAEVPHRGPSDPESAAATGVATQAASSPHRAMPHGDLPSTIAAAHSHTRWDAVAERCLACGNCTLVCPTCFCTTVEDVPDLTGTSALRIRHWDSCFTPEFSYIHGGSVRRSGRARYRQWLTHKLSSWHEQFGSSGCVGCGRCIAWCPAGIDITEEARALCAPGREGRESHGDT